MAKTKLKLNKIGDMDEILGLLLNVDLPINQYYKIFKIKKQINDATNHTRFLSNFLLKKYGVRINNQYIIPNPEDTDLTQRYGITKDEAIAIQTNITNALNEMAEEEEDMEFAIKIKKKDIPVDILKQEQIDEFDGILFEE